MESLFYVGISENAFSEKPSKWNIIDSRKNVAENYGKFSLMEIADLVGKSGHTLIPATLKGGLKENNFRSIQLFLLDFDGNKDGKGIDITYEEVRQRAEYYGLEIAFAYRTLSCPDTPPFFKFRIAFVHDIPLPDKNLAKLMIRLLLKIFPEADKACSDLSRCFLGGKGLLDFNEGARVNLVKLIHFSLPVLDTNNHFKANLETLVSKTDIAVINNKIAVGTMDMLSLFCEKPESDNIYIISHSQKSQIFYIKKSKLNEQDKKFHQKITCMKQMHKLEMGNKAGICRLFDDYCDGIELSHMERFKILTNIMHIYGGKDYFFEILKECYDSETYEKWKSDFKYIKGYAPHACDENCRYYSQCLGGKSSKESYILYRFLNDRKVICKKKQYVSVDEAYRQLEDNINRAMNSYEDGIHLIYGQTGLGKTNAITEYVAAHPEQTFLIAEPTCIMKKELYDKIAGEIGTDNVKMIRSVRDPNSLVNEEVQKKYTRFHESGRHKNAKQLIVEELDKIIKETPYAYAAINALEDIVAGIKGIENERVVIVTHAFLLNMSEVELKRYDNVIIDEDILFTQILSSTKRVSHDTIVKVSEMGVYGYSQIAKEMLSAKEGKYYKIDKNYSLPEWDSVYRNNTEEGDDSVAIEQAADNDISDLSDAGSYVLNDGVFYYFCAKKLIKRKYLVLSATLNPKIYEDYFGKDMPLFTYDVKEAAYMGKLIQYTFYALGRKSLNEKFENCQRFVSDVMPSPDYETISFKSLGDLNSHDLHFGNAIGVNGMKGKDIAIIGTPFKNPIAYLLPCCSIYGEAAVEGQEMRQRRVEYNGYEFLCMSYANPDIRNFQFYMMESDLEQTIGRARLLRNNAVVLVMSSFPCRQAEIHTENYLPEEDDEETGDEAQP